MIEALKLALPLLEDCVNSYRLKYERPAFDKAITAIKKALAQQEQEPKPATVFDDIDDDIPDICCQQYDTCLKPCTPRGRHLAQPEQEPVAWIWRYANGEEEVVFVHPRHIDATHVDAPSTITPLYTHPPQRTWVGLTYEEKSEMWEISRAALPRYATYATLIEANLKEKNT